LNWVPHPFGFCFSKCAGFEVFLPYLIRGAAKTIRTVPRRNHH
jgi:hypothetical protein